jgi:anti-sigma B factor antagonist
VFDLVGDDVESKLMDERIFSHAREQSLSDQIGALSAQIGSETTSIVRRVASLDKIQPEAQIPNNPPDQRTNSVVTGNVVWLGISKSGQVVRASRVSQEVRVETAIGVFDSHDRAKEALNDLLRQNVPRESIVFLTRSENEAVVVAEEFGAYAGGFVGGAFLAGVAAVTPLMVPGLGQVFALGSGATALLGTGSAVGKAISRDFGTPEPSHENEDAARVQKILKGGRSLILVRTAWHEIATVASGILDRLGNGISERTRLKIQTATRQVEGITVLDVRGRITVGEGRVMLRESISDLMQKGNKRILLNLYEVDYVDTSGIGELVRIHTTLRKQGGQLKLVNLHKTLMDILRMTCLHRVFDIQNDEASAIKSFVRATRATA